MKIRTNRDDFNSNCVIDYIKDVYIGFDNNVEIHLDNITEYSLYLNKEDISVIEFTSAVLNIELQNHLLKDANIIYIRMDLKVADALTGELDYIFWDIPCNMKLKEAMLYGDKDYCGESHISLEGMIM